MISYDLFGSNVRIRVNERLHEEGAKTEKTTLALLLANNNLESRAMENSRSATAFESAYRLHGAATNQRQSHIYTS